MNPMNDCRFIGRVVRTPELHHTQNNTPVASLTVAVDRGRPDADGEWPVDFIDCVAWSALAEKVCEKFAKGDLVVVCGRLQWRPYTDKDGNKRTTQEIVLVAARKLTSPNKPVVPSTEVPDFDAGNLATLSDDTEIPAEFE